jgi:hypothetical protein
MDSASDRTKLAKVSGAHHLVTIEPGSTSISDWSC